MLAALTAGYQPYRKALGCESLRFVWVSSGSDQVQAFNLASASTIALPALSLPSGSSVVKLWFEQSTLKVLSVSSSAFQLDSADLSGGAAPAWQTTTLAVPPPPSEIASRRFSVDSNREPIRVDSGILASVGGYVARDPVTSAYGAYSVGYLLDFNASKLTLVLPPVSSFDVPNSAYGVGGYVLPFKNRLQFITVDGNLNHISQGNEANVYDCNLHAQNCTFFAGGRKTAPHSTRVLGDSTTRAI